MKSILILVAGILGAIFLVAPSTMKRLIAGFGKSKSEKELEDSVKTVYDSDKVKKTDSNLKTRAELMYKSMLGVGTDEEVLFDQVDDLNPDELKKLFEFFGVRKENLFGFEAFKSNLIGWFEAELSGKTKEKMRDIFKLAGLWN